MPSEQLLRLGSRRGIDGVLNVHEMRRRARSRLPKGVFDAVDGAAGDENTMAANRRAFERVWLRPRGLADISNRDLSTTVLGDPCSFPLLAAPCGMGRMCDSEAEVAVARAARKAGIGFALSGAASCSPEEVGEVAGAPLWYQLYLRSDRDEVLALLDRVATSGYRVLCLTIDTVISALRDRDYYNRMSMPLEVSPRLLLNGLSRPRWTKDFLFGRVGRGQGFGAAKIALWNLTYTVSQHFPVTLPDLEWLRQQWDGPLVVKGVMRGDEVRQMIDAGVDGFVVSNHGGRNLDSARATLDILPEVVTAANGDAEIFIDGGLRRGEDILKAVALGARACLVGRPYMFGLAAGGEAGVARVFEIFRTELERSMALAGCATIADIDGSIVEKEQQQ